MPISLVSLGTLFNYPIYQDSRKRRTKPGFTVSKIPPIFLLLPKIKIVNYEMIMTQPY